MVLLVAILLGAFPAGSVSAQDVQVAFDRDSTLYVIEPDLRDRLDLFPDVSGFQGASLYQVDDTTYELVVQYREEGRTRRDRRTLSAEEVATLRERIAKKRSAAPEERKFTQDGRYNLIAATTVHGLIEGGLLATAFGTDSDGGGVLTLLGGTTGFFIPLLATRNARVTEAEADMAFFGPIQGYVHAVELVGIVGGGDIEGRTTAGLAAVTGAVEGAVAYNIARKNNWSGGHSEMVSFNSLEGNLIGLGIGTTIVGGDDGSSRALFGASLLGSAGGAYLGHRMGRTDRYTEGDARLYLQSSLLSAYLAGAILSTQESTSTRAGAGLLTGSAVGGAVLGRRLVRNRDFTPTQSALIGLGSFAGGLFGAALTLDASAEASRVVEALGSAGGFGLTYAVLQGDARDEKSKQASAVDLDVNVTPTMARGPGMGNSNELRPQVSLRARF